MERLFHSVTLLSIGKIMLSEMGLSAIFILLFIGLFYFMPANIAHLKNLKSRGLISLLNIATLFMLTLHFYIPVLIWVLICFLACKGKMRIPKRPPQEPPIQSGTSLPEPRRYY